jgi:hypothetical protein
MPAELRRVLLGMVNYLQSEQLANGDFPYFRTSGDSFYCPCILLSTLMHDALGYLDPHTRLYEKTYLTDLLSKDEQRFVAASVTGMRFRLRAFIAWQEESNGTWQLFGRESDLGPDTGATAAAAVSMLRTYPIDRRSSNRHVPIVESLLNAQLSLDEEANVLRFLVLTGRRVEDRVASFRTRLLSKDAPVETQTEALKRLAVAYTIARAWRQAALPGRDEVAGHLVPRILSWRQAGAKFGGQLPCALSASSLVDLGCATSSLREIGKDLISLFTESKSWRSEAFQKLEIGSAAVTVAIAISALVRINAQTGGSFC